MSQPYIGEIRMFGGNFNPNGWAFCNGQPMPISENDALFVLIGTTYGGDGQETFNLPDLQCRIPLHQGTNPSTGTNYQPGEKLGVESVTLTTQQIPSHPHTLLATSADGNSAAAVNNVAAVLPAATTKSAYGTLGPLGTLDPSSIAPAGGSQPHDNMQPYLVINFIISLFGIFPSQT
ncbi:MAG TPA: tail fiber protein [Thermoleophilaceae bacterium]|nr:tail fiber protein [Thermoleophilaceae bacterium]